MMREMVKVYPLALYPFLRCLVSLHEKHIAVWMTFMTFPSASYVDLAMNKGP